MIHPQALVDGAARLAEDVEVGPFSIIGPDVEIGAGTHVGPYTLIRGPTRIGADNRIYSFSSIGEGPQDLKYAGEPTRLEIGARNTVREYVTLNRGTVGGGGVTRIGSDNLFMAYTHVAHDCTVGDSTIFANAASLAGHVDIGDWAVLGGFTTVHQFCRVGEHSFTGLGTVVTRDVPPYVTVAGNHARPYGINKNGLRRRGFDVETVRALHRVYMLLIKGRSIGDDARAEAERLASEHPEVRRLLDFIESGERGIVR